MAKKVIKESVFEDASLIIPKENFRELLETQIAKGGKLLPVEVPRINASQNGFVYNKVTRRNEHVEYEETAKLQYVQDYKRWNDYNVEIYKSSFSSPNNTYLSAYNSHIWTKWGTDLIKEYKEEIRRLINQMQSDIEKLNLIKCTAVNGNTAFLQGRRASEDKVFIVHGHDGELKEKVARTLEKLGLKPIILHEQADGGRTIIEKFEDNAEDCGFAVILLTADDLGQSNEESKNGLNPKQRARQNVVFEMGYFIGRLGRRKVVTLLDVEVDKPGDLDGIIYVSTSDEAYWKVRLVKELKNCGYKVDANTII